MEIAEIGPSAFYRLKTSEQICSLSIPAVATAWCFRGTFGLERSFSADYSNANSAATNPPALFRTDVGRDGRQIGAYGDLGQFPMVEAAVGKQNHHWYRESICGFAMQIDRLKVKYAKE